MEPNLFTDLSRFQEATDTKNSVKSEPLGCQNFDLYLFDGVFRVLVIEQGM